MLIANHNINIRQYDEFQYLKTLSEVFDSYQLSDQSLSFTQYAQHHHLDFIEGAIYSYQKD